MPEKRDFSFYLYDKPTLVIIDWYNIYNRYKNIDLKVFFDYLKEYKEIYEIRFYQGVIKDKDWSVNIIAQAKEIGYQVVTKESKYTRIDISKESYLVNTLKMLQELLIDISANNSDVSNKIYTIKQRIESRLSRGEITMVDGVLPKFVDNDDDLVSEIYDFIETLDSSLVSLTKKIDEFKSEIGRPIKKLKCDFDAEIARDIVLNIDNFDNLILFSGDGDFASTIKYLIEEKAKRVFTMYPQGSFGEIDYVNFGLITYDALGSGKKTFMPNFTPKPVDHILQKITKKEPADCSAGPDTYNLASRAQEVK
jgi:uncharacterized LabA/DUF88 family protein